MCISVHFVTADRSYLLSSRAKLHVISLDMAFRKQNPGSSVGARGLTNHAEAITNADMGFTKDDSGANLTTTKPLTAATWYKMETELSSNFDREGLLLSRSDLLLYNS